jgi:hypothetical protein
LEEIFLPYAQDSSGVTVYERLRDQRFFDCCHRRPVAHKGPNCRGSALTNKRKKLMSIQSESDTDAVELGAIGNDDGQRCSICGQPYDGMGNNAHPINSGRCCDGCNWQYVIAARMGCGRSRTAQAYLRGFGDGIRSMIQYAANPSKSFKAQNHKGGV